MEKLRTIIFFITAPVVFIPAAFMVLTYEEKGEAKWYLKIWSKQGNYLERVIGIILAPLYAFFWLYLKIVYPVWDVLIGSGSLFNAFFHIED